VLAPGVLLLLPVPGAAPVARRPASIIASRTVGTAFLRAGAANVRPAAASILPLINPAPASPLRSARAKNIFVKILGEVRERYRFALVGYVVMPEHIHLLIGEPAKATPSTVMQVLKQRVSRQLRRGLRGSAAQLRLRFDRYGDSLPRLWQLRFHGFNVWSHKKRIEKLQ
jgi:REP element-mobilizing transposase RayT